MCLNPKDILTMNAESTPSPAFGKNLFPSFNLPYNISLSLSAACELLMCGLHLQLVN
jgi:hypothetical protein